MKTSFSKRDKFILAIGGLLLALLIAYAQFVSLTPLKNDLAVKKQTLLSEQNLLDIATQKKANITKTVEDTRELQKQVPVKPLEDQFILDLEKAENVSNSQIKTMSFTKNADVTASGNDPNAQNKNAQENGATGQNNSETQAQGTATTQNGTAQQSATQASGLKKLSVTMSVEAPNYESFEKFIQTVETLQRIVVVESISYSGGQEITALDQEQKSLSFNVTVSTFYMPALGDLKAQLPKIDVPAPAGKENPLSQFSDTTKP